MKKIFMLPRHNCLSLTQTNTIEELHKSHKPQVIPQEHTVSDTLNYEYEEDAALLQYTLRTQSGDILPVGIRLKEESLSFIDPSEMYVSMDWAILDWDLKSKGIRWGDSQKPETKEAITAFIKAHPMLSKAYAFYFSKSGVRILYRISNPLRLDDSLDIQVWRLFYSNLVNNIDVSEVGGEIELRLDPFILNRTPKYMDKGVVIKEDVIYLTQRAVKMPFPSREEVKAAEPQREKKSFPKLDEAKVLEELYADPFISYLRESGQGLPYQDWRGLGVNIATLLSEGQAYNVFNQISQWDQAGYDAYQLNQQFPHILESASNYGPVTWSHFSIDVSAFYGDVEPTSSLAAHISRKVKDSAMGTSSANDNTKDVFKKLNTQTKQKNGQSVTTPTKCLSNLITILTNDNRWANLLRRNHLGGIDMIGDRAIIDEDIFSWREAIHRLYGLVYKKDDMWDAIKLICHRNEYNPVSDYLRTLKWDKKDRLEGLAKALGQTDNLEFAKSILKKFLISAVVRPLEWDNYLPTVNWKVDTVLILKGSQGKRKSSFFKALCKDDTWFSDNLPSITAERKDASLHMMGKWLVEQAEFEHHVARSSVEAMKAFITRERENFRKAYGRAEINQRRPSILVGTTNSSSFLNDPTGDRRYWVLEIPETHFIDLNWVVQNRDQLWSQAIELYKQGEIWWLTENESIQSNTQNAKFRRPNALNEAILEYLNTEPKLSGLNTHPDYEDDCGFTLKQLVTTGLDKRLADIKSSEAHNITLYLTKMGYVKVRCRLNKQRVYVFRKLKDFNDEEAY